MKVLLLTQYGMGIDSAEILSKAGHDVFVFLQYKGTETTDDFGEKIIKVDTWRPYLDGIDVILADGMFFETHWRLLSKFCNKLIGLEMYGSTLLVESIAKNKLVLPIRVRTKKKWWQVWRRNG
jgi:hypothetical protein